MRLLKNILFGIAGVIAGLVIIALIVAFCIGLGIVGIWLGHILANAFDVEEYDFYGNSTDGYQAFGIVGFIIGALLGIAIVFGIGIGIDEWQKENQKQ